MLQFKNTVPANLKFQKAIKNPVPVKCVQIQEPFEVHTIEGVMKGKAGDWLMVGVNNEMYVCDNTIFIKTYKIAAK